MQELDQMAKPTTRPTKRRTPVERYIDEGTLVNRKVRWELEQVKLGFTRVTLRVHTDDVERLKTYASRLLKKRTDND